MFNQYSIDIVMHFAANSIVGESVQDLFKYYQNNVSATLILLQTMLEHGIKNFSFSSTAAVYSIPSVPLIDEQQPTQPINPYGQSKLMVENILKDFSAAYGLNYIARRYFNASSRRIRGNRGRSFS